MSQGFWIFILIVVFLAGGLMAFWRNAKSELPKNLPPPLPPDDDEEEK
jgi:hypothetical protein